MQKLTKKIEESKSLINIKLLSKKIREFTKEINFEEIVILGTGPSLEEGVNYLKGKTVKDNVLVICLKQSYERVNKFGYKLIHMTNPWNFKKYKYEYEEVFKIYFHEYYAKFKPQRENYDLYFCNENIIDPIKNSILAKSQFSEFLYSNEKTFSQIRPPMPGIFGESLYLAIFIGCKNLRLFGVDYSYNSKKQKDHYYNSPYLLERFLKIFTKSKIIQKLFYKLGFRTQYSIAFDEEIKVAIPGYSKFIKYIKEIHSIEVYGWKH